MAVVKGRESIGSRLFDAGNYAFLLVLAVTFLYPFWTIILQAFSPPDDLYRLGLHVWISDWRLEPWYYVFRGRERRPGLLQHHLPHGFRHARIAAGDLHRRVRAVQAQPAVSRTDHRRLSHDPVLLRRPDPLLPADPRPWADQHPPGADPAAGDQCLQHYHRPQLPDDHRPSDGGLGGDRRRPATGGCCSGSWCRCPSR